MQRQVWQLKSRHFRVEPKIHDRGLPCEDVWCALSSPNWLKSFTAGDECRFSFCDKELAKVNLADPQVLCN